MNIDYCYSTFLRTRFPEATESKIRNTEVKANVSFPASYRKFLRTYNGGYFKDPTIVCSIDGAQDDCLDVLFGIGASHSSAELCSDSNLALFDDNNPRLALPIGYTLMGALLALGTCDSNLEMVFYKKPWRSEFFLLSDDIFDFFELLVE